MKKRIAFLAVFVASACVAETTLTQDTVEVDEPFTSVVITIDSGDVRLRGVDEPGAIVTTFSEFRTNEPDIGVSVQGDVLRIVLDCPKGARDCSVDLNLAVPVETDVEIDGGATAVDAAGIEGDVSANIGAGDLELDRIGGTIGINVGAGAVVATNLSGMEADISAGSGDIDLDFVVAPDLVDASNGAGHIALRVVADVYAVNASAGLGRAEVTGVTVDENAAKRLTADAGTGRVQITGYEP